MKVAKNMPTCDRSLARLTWKCTCCHIQEPDRHTWWWHLIKHKTHESRDQIATKKTTKELYTAPERDVYHDILAKLLQRNRSTASHRTVSDKDNSTTNNASWTPQNERIVLFVIPRVWYCFVLDWEVRLSKASCKPIFHFISFHMYSAEWPNERYEVYCQVLVNLRLSSSKGKLTSGGHEVSLSQMTTRELMLTKTVPQLNSIIDINNVPIYGAPLNTMAFLNIPKSELSSRIWKKKRAHIPKLGVCIERKTDDGRSNRTTYYKKYVRLQATTGKRMDLAENSSLLQKRKQSAQARATKSNQWKQRQSIQR